MHSQEGGPKTDAPAKALGGIDYLTILYRQRRLLGCVIALCLALAGVARLVIPNQYEGVVAMITANDDQNFASSAAGALASLGLVGASPQSDRKAAALAT